MALTDATVSARSSLARQQFCVGEGGGLGEGRDTGEIVLAEKKNQGEATHTQTQLCAEKDGEEASNTAGIQTQPAQQRGDKKSPEGKNAVK